MISRMLGLAAGALVVGCSGGSSTSSGSGGSDSSDCVSTQQEIRDAAAKRGLDPTTVCTSTDPAVQKDFAAACAKAKGC